MLMCNYFKKYRLKHFTVLPLNDFLISFYYIFLILVFRYLLFHQYNACQVIHKKRYYIFLDNKTNIQKTLNIS